LYVGKKPLKFNIPEVQAVDRLVDLIREHGRWVDPIDIPSPVCVSSHIWPRDLKGGNGFAVKGAKR
jgi:hypothetical protein